WRWSPRTLPSPTSSRSADTALPWRRRISSPQRSSISCSTTELRHLASTYLGRNQMNLNALKKTVAVIALASLPTLAYADNTEGVKHPLWYKEPSEKTMKIAAMDDITDVVVSDGQRGEDGFPASKLVITDE